MSTAKSSETYQDQDKDVVVDFPWFANYETGVPRTIDYLDAPLQRLLQNAAERYPNNIATSFLGGRLTYAELYAQVNAFARALETLGVKKGDRVALLLPNCPQMVIAYYGALTAGAIVVPTNPLYVENEMVYQFNDSGAETVVTLTKFYPTVSRTRLQTKVRNIIVTNIKDYFSPLMALLFTLFKEEKEGHRISYEGDGNVYSFKGLVESNRLPSRDGQLAPAEVKADDTALFQYTGGTTGVSKGAMLTHRNLMANALQTRYWLADAQEGREVVLSVIPFFHVYGMSVCMNFAVGLASTMVLLPRFDLVEVLKTINKHKPTIFPGVPTMYVAINNHPDVRRYDLKSIRVCLSGAAPLPVEVQQKFESLTGGKLVEGYGLTEASPVTHCTPINGRRKEGSIGLPFPDTEARIVDLDTRADALPIGSIGELAIRGPQVMKGYWNRPEESRDVLPGEWLFTGDIAKMDEDGYFFIIDRKKDMILAGGYNIYPRDVEEVLFQHPKIKEAVVAGVPDEYRGETVKAYVVLKEGETATAEEIIDFCKPRLARYKAPKLVEFRTELPKTMVGKVLRRVLLEEEMRKRAGG
ncbi:MAG: long-chain fatty acid--CoA ligase [Chloroflexi bacterium]|nr:long-chain fatty acid--CoA ligase [Chloroflexota bacterium]